MLSPELPNAGSGSAAYAWEAGGPLPDHMGRLRFILFSAERSSACSADRHWPFSVPTILGKGDSAVKQPASVPTTDMVFTIDYRRDVGSVARVFAATHDFILMCEKVDRELVRCLGLRTRPAMDIVAVEFSSIRTILRQVLERTDNSAIQERGVWAFAHTFLIVGKESLLSFMDASDHRREWERSVQRIYDAAQNGRPKSLPPFQPPRRDKLLNSLGLYERMKRRLKPGDHAYLEAPNVRHDVNLPVRVDPQVIAELKTARTTKSSTEETLVVKKPDFLGSSQWELYYQGQRVNVAVEDHDWLRRFQAGELEIRPRDGLSCQLRVEESYSRDGRWLGTRYYIDKVFSVVPGPIS